MQWITTVIALVVAWVAIQQFLLARERFKLDLFEKRFAVYKAAEDFITHALGDGVSHEQLITFYRATYTATFLFGDDITKFLKELATKGNNLWSIRHRQQELAGGSPERMKLGERRQEIINELITTQEQLRNTFSPYLKFKNWKHGMIPLK
jgi:hypothetical protein